MFSFFTNSKKVAELESKINDLNSIIEKLETKIENFETIIEDKITDDIESKVSDIDWDEHITEALSNFDLREQVQEAIEDSFRHATISVDF